MSIAVSVEHVSKTYRLGAIGSASLVDDWARASVGTSEQSRAATSAATHGRET